MGPYIKHVEDLINKNIDIPSEEPDILATMVGKSIYKQELKKCVREWYKAKQGFKKKNVWKILKVSTMVVNPLLTLSDICRLRGK